MDAEDWVVVYTAEGKLAAEMIRLTLESFGIPAVIEQESVGSVYGLTIGPLGETQILVQPAKAVEALEILKAMENGSLEIPSDELNLKDSNKDEESDLTK